MARLLGFLVPLLFGFSSTVEAALIEMLFDFPGGFSASFNGGPNAATGSLTFRILVDDTTPDEPFETPGGTFAAEAVYLTAPELGLANERVTAPAPLYVFAFTGGFAIYTSWGPGPYPAIGWNGGPGALSLMSNVTDLRTLPLPTVVTMTSTFFDQSITFENGDTLGSDVHGNGAQGLFTARSPNAVPEPSIVAFLKLALAVACFVVARNLIRRLKNRLNHDNHTYSKAPWAFAALSVMLLSSAGAAQGKIIEWNLKDVVFDDGGTATGFFFLDLDESVPGSPWRHPLGNFDIKVSGGTSGVPPFEYTPSNHCSLVEYDGSLAVIYGQVVPGYCGGPFSFRALQLSPAPLTDAGGTVALGGQEGYPTRCCRAIVRGELIGVHVPVPEPSATVFVVVGLAGLAAFRISRGIRQSPA